MAGGKGGSWFPDLPGLHMHHPSLASHTLRREEGSGHTAADELSPRNAIIEHSG